MYRMILIVAFALVVGSGVVVAAAQGGTGSVEAPEGGGMAACATPVASPGASPEIAEEIAAVIATAAVSPDASPVDIDAPCGTPEVGTPAS